MKFATVFSGFGGADLGLCRAGMTPVFQVENNAYATRVLEKHWPGLPRWQDARGFSGCGFDHPDLIWFSDPCQENSGARNTNNARYPRLGDHVIRIVDELRPRLVVRENPTHTRKDAPWPWWRMRACFESLGYAVLPFRLRSCCFGAFHQRDRLFLLAELSDANSERLERWEAKTEAGHASKPAGRIHANDWLAVSASRGLRSRRGFPGYVERVTGCGNCVDPAVAEWIGRRIIEASGVTQ